MVVNAKDNGSSANPDSHDFRESTRADVSNLLGLKVDTFRQLMRQKEFDAIPEFMITTADELNAAFMGGKVENIREGQYFPGTIHPNIWTGPKDGLQAEGVLIAGLLSKYKDGEIPTGSLAKRFYLLEVLLHKYDNANGRVARTFEVMCNKTEDDSELSQADLDYVLGITREGEKYNEKGIMSMPLIKPIMFRMLRGVCYYAISEGIHDYEAIGLPKLPNEGVELIAKELEIGSEEAKDRFIKYMVFDSSLEFWGEGSEKE